ncbi:MAG: endonuclease III [Erysipelotrichaceae bacterium]|jgi:endonuclease-3|nr:endonuclease III [Erysipelotrichaceae bacterium]
MKPEAILKQLAREFPEAGCELHYKSLYQLCVAVLLSAQTTDVSVNQVTPALFAHFPDVKSLAEGELDVIEKDIKRLGLYRNKAKNLLGFAQSVMNNYQGEIPQDIAQLVKLPGIGRKCANVIASEYFHTPALAVDTHVERVSKRLGLVSKDASVGQVEKTLCKKIPKERWIDAHHLFIFFGRYRCKAKSPLCMDCFYKDECREYRQRQKKDLKRN